MIKIEKVGLPALRELQQIGVESYLPHYRHLWKENDAERYLQRCFGEKSLAAELTDENVEYYIISAEDENVGVLKLVLRKPLPDSRVENALYLEKIYFIKEWTGKGVGRELINFTFERARKLNRDCVWLVAMDTAEKVVAAYERAGFTVHSRSRIDFERMNDEYRGTFIMKKCFEANGKLND